MITLLKHYVKRFNEIFEHAGLNRAARQLELLSDRQLQDIGVSREQLQYGAAAYPWKEQTDNVVQVGDFTKTNYLVAALEKNQRAA